MLTQPLNAAVAPPPVPDEVLALREEIGLLKLVVEQKLAQIAACEAALAERDARVATLEGALKGMLTMADVALPQFNWGASALSARAIGLLNEAPIAARAALGGDRES